MFAFHGAHQNYETVRPFRQNQRNAASAAIVPEFKTYIAGWWSRTRKVFWFSFLTSLFVCALANVMFVQ